MRDRAHASEPDRTRCAFERVVASTTVDVAREAIMMKPKISRVGPRTDLFPWFRWIARPFLADDETVGRPEDVPRILVTSDDDACATEM